MKRRDLFKMLPCLAALPIIGRMAQAEERINFYPQLISPEEMVEKMRRAGSLVLQNSDFPVMKARIIAEQRCPQQHQMGQQQMQGLKFTYPEVFEEIKKRA